MAQGAREQFQPFPITLLASKGSSGEQEEEGQASDPETEEPDENNTEDETVGEIAAGETKAAKTKSNQSKLRVWQPEEIKGWPEDKERKLEIVFMVSLGHYNQFSRLAGRRSIPPRTTTLPIRTRRFSRVLQRACSRRSS